MKLSELSKFSVFIFTKLSSSLRQLLKKESLISFFIFYNGKSFLSNLNIPIMNVTTPIAKRTPNFHR